MLAPVLIVVILLSILLYSNSHTVSWGYSYNQACDLTVWAGTYHDHQSTPYPPFHGAEGSLSLTLVNATTLAIIGVPIIHSFDNVTGTRPLGLVDGISQFYSGSKYGQIYPNSSSLAANEKPKTYQGANVVGVPGGFYLIKYDPASVFDDVFRPMNGIIDGIYISLNCTNPSVPYSASFAYQPVANQNSILCDLNAALFGPTGSPSGWSCTGQSPNNPVCTGSLSSWFGVTCHDGAVLGISLSSTGGSATSACTLAAGTLSSSLGQLFTLKDLAITSCSVHGIIPSAYGDLSSLTAIHFATNSMTGSIPTVLGNLQSLYYLDLYSNLFTGTIPTQLGSLLHLLSITLQKNSLSGYVSSALCSLVGLTRLDISQNRIVCYASCLSSLTLFTHDTGIGSTCAPSATPSSRPSTRPTGGPTARPSVTPTSAPTTISMETIMCEVHAALFGSGPSPANWACTGHVAGVSVCGTPGWEGVICVGGVVTSISVFGHSASGTGTLSSYLGYLSFMTSFNISNIGVHGPIPTAIGLMTSLTYFALGNNQITGSIPTTFGSLSHLRSIPTQLGSLTGLSMLNLDYNQLTGSISSSLCTMSSLSYLNIDKNKRLNCFYSCTSSITTFVYNASMYICPSQIEIAMCNLNAALFGGGAVEPTNWGCNGQKSIVDICGPPGWAGVVCVGGQVTSITLTGTGVTSTGTMSSSLGLLSSLVTLNMSGLGFAGSIPTSYGSLTSLTYIGLGGNKMTGSIPTSFGYMSYLQYLYLDGNNLAGSLSTSLGRNSLACYSSCASNITGFQSDPSVSSTCSPSTSPTSSPSKTPTYLPTKRPSKDPTLSPTRVPSLQPTTRPSRTPNSYSTIAQNSIMCDLFYALVGEGLGPTDWGCLNGNPSIPVCQGGVANWAGVTCDSTNFVTCIDVSNILVVGTIPSSLSKLMYLSCLTISNTDVHGTLPSTLGDLTTLTSIDLINNKLSGSIPTDFGKLSSLSVLDFSSNKLTGCIPTQLGSLSLTTTIDLSGNLIRCSIPSSLGDLTNLIRLDVSGNLLTGSIPSSLCADPALTYLDTSSNFIDCYYPCTSSVTQFIRDGFTLSSNVNWNCINGNPVSDVCTWAGVTCTIGVVTGISITDPGATGSLPTSLGDITSLTSLIIASTSLIGVIPTTLDKLTSLSVLDITNNGFTGSLPVLTDLILLRNLDLSGNSFSGSILSSIGTLTNLVTLNLGDNSLTGSIPTSLGDVLLLTRIDLGRNSLSGSLPTTLSKLTRLVSLSVNDNLLTGTVSSTMGDLSLLTSLNLGNNDFSGSLPPSLGKLTNLVVLLLNGNALSGAIPTSFCSMSSLTTISTSGNLLSSIPQCLLAISVNDIPTFSPTASPVGGGDGGGGGGGGGVGDGGGGGGGGTMPQITPTPLLLPDVCLTFHLMDTFGDGWGPSGRLHVMDSVGIHKTYTSLPNDKGLTIVEYCIDPITARSGRLVTVGLFGLDVPFTWEMYWSAMDNMLRIPVMGGYNTFLTFELFGWNRNFRFVLTKFHNIVTPIQE
eukprot:gene9574-19896_t